MNDKTRREDFDKKVVLPNVIMLKNKIHNEMKLENISRFIYTCHPLFLKLKQTNNKNKPFFPCLHCSCALQNMQNLRHIEIVTRAITLHITLHQNNICPDLDLLLSSR